MFPFIEDKSRIGLHCLKRVLHGPICCHSLWIDPGWGAAAGRMLHCPSSLGHEPHVLVSLGGHWSMPRSGFLMLPQLIHRSPGAFIIGPWFMSLGLAINMLVSGNPYGDHTSSPISSVLSFCDCLFHRQPHQFNHRQTHNRPQTTDHTPQTTPSVLCWALILLLFSYSTPSKRMPVARPSLSLLGGFYCLSPWAPAHLALGWRGKYSLFSFGTFTKKTCDLFSSFGGGGQHLLICWN